MATIKPENIDFINSSNVIGINLSENYQESIAKNRDISFRFNSFNRPDKLSRNFLHIVLDHSFEFDETDNIIFIDHHLVEQTTGVIYKSNADMMIKNYEFIFNTIVLLNEKMNKSIKIWMHSDIDGLCSGMIMKKILDDASGKLIDINYDSKLKLIHIIANYGDIDPEAKLGLSDIFSKESEINIFDKKLSSYCKSLSRFMKATRSIYDYLYLHNYDADLVKSLDLRLQSSYINHEDIENFLKNIQDSLVNLVDIDIIRSLYFFNLLAQNKILNLILEVYNQEIADIINNYIEPTTPSFEMNIIFLKDPTRTKFKLLIIDSPFDCGRSVIWKYRSNLNIFLKKCGPANQWKYRISDWSKDRNLLDYDNVVCYNKQLKKISIDGTNSSAFDVAKNIFDGGGHATTDDGRSLGSVVIEDENLFFKSFILTDFF